MPPRLTLIVARARNGVIGRDNTLPWRLPEDLAHFKAATMGHALIMGRKTFDSIGRPLPGRRTIVLSRDPSWQRPGCERAASLDEAVALCSEASEVFIAGGEQIYREALTRADRALITEVELNPEGDAFFPPLDAAVWRQLSRQTGHSSTGIDFAIAVYERQRNTPIQS